MCYNEKVVCRETRLALADEKRIGGRLSQV